MPGFPALTLLEQRKLAATPFSWQLRNVARTQPNTIQGRSAARALNAVQLKDQMGALNLTGVDQSRRDAFNSNVQRMSQLAGGGVSSPLDIFRSRGERISRAVGAAHDGAKLPAISDTTPSRLLDYPDKYLATTTPTFNLSLSGRGNKNEYVTPEELSANRHRFPQIEAHAPEPGVSNVSVGGLANPQIRSPSRAGLPTLVQGTSPPDTGAVKLPYDPGKVIYRAHQSVEHDAPLWASPHPDVPARYFTGISGEGAPRSFVAKGLPSGVRPDVHYSPHVGDDGKTQASPRTAANPTAPLPPELTAVHNHRDDLPDYETTLPGHRFEALPTLAHVPPGRVSAYGLNNDEYTRPDATKAMAKRLMGLEASTPAWPSTHLDAETTSNVDRLNTIIQRRAAKLSAVAALETSRPWAAVLVAPVGDNHFAGSSRPLDKVRPGGTLDSLFGLPGGKLDPGETARQAVMREAREEGWNPRGVSLEPIHIDENNPKLPGPVWFYGADSAKVRTDYVERDRLVPLRLTIADIKRKTGFGDPAALKAYLRGAKVSALAVLQQR